MPLLAHRAVSFLAVLAGCVDPPPDRVRDAVVDTAVAQTTPAVVTTTTPRDAPPLELCINEVMPSNSWSYTDETGARPDWIELHNPGEVDVGLGGWFLSDDAADPFAHALSGGLVVPAGGFLLLLADGLPELGPLHLPFSLAEEGEEVALFRSDASGEVLRYGAVVPDLSIARSPDCCAVVASCAELVWGGTPGETNLVPVLLEEEPVPRGSSWRWRADLAPPPVDWISEVFDDTAWSDGAGFLGYGDAHVVTELPYGPDPNAKWLAYQFRLAFEIVDVEQIVDLWLDLARDDGAVVYLNGAEVVRSNLPVGVLDPGTLALAAIGDADEYTYQRWAVAPDALVEGVNTLAVEVRQAAGTSSDLTFDLGVVLQRVSP